MAMLKIPAGILPLLVSLTPGKLLAVAVFTSNFEPPLYQVGINDNLAGQDGWVINDPPVRPALADLSYFYTYNIVAEPNNHWGALGGHWSTPTVDNPPGVELTHPVSLPLADSAFSVDFAVARNQLPGVSRDNFGWSFKSGGNDLLRIAFEPVVADSGKLEIVWYDSLGGRNSIAPVAQAISYDSIYQLRVSTVASGGDAVFSASLIPGVGSPLNFGGTLPGKAAANLTAFGADFDVTGIRQLAGDNTMFFDNVSLVPIPEAVSGLVYGLAALGFCVLAGGRTVRDGRNSKKPFNAP